MSNERNKTNIRFIGGSAQLYTAAVKSFQLIPKDVADLEAGQIMALSSLILSAVSIEGFLNELGDMIASDPEGAPWRPDEINKYGAVWRTAEDCNGSIRYKYERALDIFGKRPPDKGMDPWQSFDILIKVRDSLVHLKTGKGTFTLDSNSVKDDAKLVEALHIRKILADSGTQLNAHWVNLIQTRAAAYWSCKTASSIVKGLIDLIPGELEISDSGKEVSWKSFNLRPFYNAFALVEYR